MGRTGAILSIDLGTSRCKAAVFDFEGSLLASSWRDNIPRGDRGEEDVARWTSNIRWCAARAAKSSRSEIVRIAITGQGSCAVWLDAGAKPVRPVITHTDTRSAKQLEVVKREFEGLSYPAAKIFPMVLWLKEREESKFRAIRHVLDIRQYIGYYLTGELRFDRAAFTDAQRRRFAEMSGLPMEAFGEPHDYDNPVGFLAEAAADAFGVLKGTPVFIAPMDGLCGIIGSGIREEGQMADIGGSTEVISAPVPPRSPLAVIPFLDTGLTLYYASPPFGLAYKWFVDNFYSTRGEVAVKQVVRDVSGTAPDLAAPFFVPIMKTVGFHASMENCFLGLKPGQSRAHMARALMEGIGFELALTVEKLEKGGAGIDEIRVSGGTAYQEVWNQMKADITRRPVLLPRVVETSCLGAAIMAATSSSGPYESLKEGMLRMVRTGKTYKPRKSLEALYRERIARYAKYSSLLAQEN